MFTNEIENSLLLKTSWSTVNSRLHTELGGKGTAEH